MVFITNSAIALRSSDLTVRVSVILRKNVVSSGDRHFDNLSGSHSF